MENVKEKLIHSYFKSNEVKEGIDLLFDSILTKNESTILRYRFGLVDGVCKTLEEVSKMYGLTREEVRQIEAKGFRKIKHPVNRKKYSYSAYLIINEYALK